MARGNKAISGQTEVVLGVEIWKCKKLKIKEQTVQNTILHSHENSNSCRTWRTWLLLGVGGGQKKKKVWKPPACGDFLLLPDPCSILQCHLKSGPSFGVGVWGRLPHLCSALRRPSKRRPQSAVTSRHHPGRRFLWFLWYCDERQAENGVMRTAGNRDYANRTSAINLLPPPHHNQPLIRCSD